jgi:hypothetical protein
MECIIAQDIPDIFRYINDVAGAYNPTAHELVANETKDHSVFQIIYRDSQKQTKLKQVREAYKNKIQEFTEKDVSDKVWKYRYLQPGLDTEYFERNIGDYVVVKHRLFTIADPNTRRVCDRLPPKEFVAIVF